MYITWKKILELGPTPDCKGCSADSRYRNKDCVERFLAHYGEDEPETHVTELPPPPNVSTPSSSSSALVSSTNTKSKEDSSREHGCSESRINGESNPSNHSQLTNTAEANATAGVPSSQTFCDECFERHFACICGVTSSKCSPCANPSTSAVAHATTDGPPKLNKDTADGENTQKKRRRGHNRATASKQALPKPLQGISAAVAAIDDILKHAMEFFNETELKLLDSKSTEHYNRAVKGLAANKSPLTTKPIPRHNSKLPCYNCLLSFAAMRAQSWAKQGMNLTFTW